MVDLATAAEAAGVDLRILLLQRPAKDILISTTVKRHFGNPMHEMLVLSDNAATLHSELEALDPAFFRCVATQSDDFNAQRWDQLAPFLLAGVALPLPEPAQKMLAVIHPPSKNVATPKNAEIFSSAADRAMLDRFGVAVDLLNRACRAA